MEITLINDEYAWKLVWKMNKMLEGGGIKSKCFLRKMIGVIVIIRINFKWMSKCDWNEFQKW